MTEVGVHLQEGTVESLMLDPGAKEDFALVDSPNIWSNNWKMLFTEPMTGNSVQLRYLV